MTVNVRLVGSDRELIEYLRTAIPDKASVPERRLWSMAKSPQDLVQENPNASVAASAGALVTVGIWVATALGLDVPPEVAAAVTTLVAAGVVFVGKRKKAAPPTTLSRPTT